MKPDPKDLEIGILDQAVDDWTGLYELIWWLNSQYPGETLGMKYDLADKVVRSLYEKGWIEFVKEWWEEKNCLHEPFVPEDLDKLLSNPCTWYPENSDNLRICIVATAAGDEAYKAKCDRS